MKNNLYKELTTNKSIETIFKEISSEEEGIRSSYDGYDKYEGQVTRTGENKPRGSTKAEQYSQSRIERKFWSFTLAKNSLFQNCFAPKQPIVVIRYFRLHSIRL